MVNISFVCAWWVVVCLCTAVAMVNITMKLNDTPDGAMFLLLPTQWLGLYDSTRPFHFLPHSNHILTHCQVSLSLPLPSRVGVEYLNQTNKIFGCHWNLGATYTTKQPYASSVAYGPVYMFILRRDGRSKSGRSLIVYRLLERISSSDMEICPAGPFSLIIPHDSHRRLHK